MEGTSVLLEWIILYGAPMIAFLLFLSQGGVPLPGTLIVIVSGAFIGQGFLDAHTTVGFAFLGAVVGDVLLYWIGNRFRAPLARRFGDTHSWKRAQALVARHGGIAVFLTRWLVTPIATPTTLVAAATGYAFRPFVLRALSGELLWIGGYTALGYAFSDAWEALTSFIDDILGLILAAISIGLGAWTVARRTRSAERP